MIQVGLLTETQKDELIGTWFAPDSFFNPIQDINDNWVIGQGEMYNNENPAVSWVKDLPLIEYVPKPSPFPPFEN